MSVYLVPEATATLVIDDGPYAGAEIEVRLTLSPRVYFGIQQWVAQMSGAADTDATLAATTEMAELFVANGLTSWNITNRAGPVPVTVEGVLSLDWQLVAKLVATWISAIGTVPVPLPGASVDGSRPTPRPSAKPLRSTGTSSTRAGHRKKSTRPTSVGSSAS